MTTRVLWTGAFAIAALAIVAELLPVIFGGGAKATWDWSFTYVTLHFVVLPIGAAVHVVATLRLGFLLIRQSVPRALGAIIPIISPVTYLVLLYVHPLFWLVGSKP